MIYMHWVDKYSQTDSGLLSTHQIHFFLLQVSVLKNCAKIRVPLGPTSKKLGHTSPGSPIYYGRSHGQIYIARGPRHFGDIR